MAFASFLAIFHAIWRRNLPMFMRMGPALWMLGSSFGRKVASQIAQVCLQLQKKANLSGPGHGKESTGLPGHGRWEKALHLPGVVEWEEAWLGVSGMVGQVEGPVSGDPFNTPCNYLMITTGRVGIAVIE